MSKFPKPCYLLGLIWSDNFYNGHECPCVARPLQIAFRRKKVTHAYYTKLGKHNTQIAHTLIT